MRIVPLILSLVLSGTAAAAQGPSYPDAGYQQRMDEAANLSFSVVAEIDSEIQYIQGAGEKGPSENCEFCGDQTGVNENDGDVVQHLLRISNSARQIGDLTLTASKKNPAAAQFEIRQACDLIGSTLTDIPAARATIFWEPVGVARPRTFDSTQAKLQRAQSLLPNCF